MFFLSQQFTDNITEAWNEKFKAIDEIIKSDNLVDSDEKRDLIAELQFENSSLVTSIFLVLPDLVRGGMENIIAPYIFTELKFCLFF